MPLELAHGRLERHNTRSDAGRLFDSSTRRTITSLEDTSSGASDNDPL